MMFSNRLYDQVGSAAGADVVRWCVSQAQMAKMELHVSFKLLDEEQAIANIMGVNGLNSVIEQLREEFG